MCGRRLLFVKLMLILIGKSSTSHCDQATTAIVDEGVLGQTPDFNWLGVLRVHLHDGDTLQIAVSGIVLIKDKYALANADDVARIPQRIFQSDTLAMFIPTGDTPWYVAPLSYVMHPEYEYTTFNTIAIIELNFNEEQDSPLVPICFPTFAYNTSNYLYTTGYTDEDKVLEKVIYKIQYLERHICEEFYNRAGLTDKNHAPTAYLCGYAPRNSTQCVWDNGMVLVSNATGWFTLIGLGLRGPGCAAPARFIDIAPYVSWINSVTQSGDEIYDSVDYRRQEQEDEFVPAHELFTSNTSHRQRQYQLRSDIIPREYFTYPFDTEKPRHFTIEAEDENTIFIYPFNTTLEAFKGACGDGKTLFYREIFELKGNFETRGATTYKLSLYDLMYKLCTCVTLTIECTHREQSVLAFKDTIDFNLGTQLGESGETPEELFRYYPITERTVAPPTGKPNPWKNANLKPKYITQKTKSGSVINYDLYIKYYFIGYAKLTFALYSNSAVKPQGSDIEGRRRAKVKAPHVHKPYWGMRETVGRRIKPEETFVAAEEHEVVQATISDAWRCVPAPVVLALGYFCLRNFP